MNEEVVAEKKNEKKSKKFLTADRWRDIIVKVAAQEATEIMERCPSGLRSWSWKPVIPEGTVGSNPTLSAN